MGTDKSEDQLLDSLPEVESNSNPSTTSPQVESNNTNPTNSGQIRLPQIVVVPQAASQPHKKEMTHFERQSLSIMGAQAFMSFITLLIFCGQFYLALDSGKQTNRIIEADERMAKAMEKSNEQAEKSFAATLEQNNKVLDTTINNARLEQRAWVGLSNIQITPFPIEAGKPVVAKISIVNTGKTHAQGARISMHVASRPASEKVPPKSGYVLDPERAGSIATLFPQQTFGSDVTLRYPDESVAIPNDKNVADFKAGKLKIFVSGEITYRDVFGAPHKTYFCNYFTATQNAAACSTHNEAD